MLHSHYETLVFRKHGILPESGGEDFWGIQEDDAKGASDAELSDHVAGDEKPAEVSARLGSFWDEHGHRKSGASDEMEDEKWPTTTESVQKKEVEIKLLRIYPSIWSTGTGRFERQLF
jgi:hypothetical protein